MHGDETEAEAFDAGEILVAPGRLILRLRPSSVSSSSTDMQFDVVPQSPQPSQTSALMKVRLAMSSAGSRLRCRAKLLADSLEEVKRTGAPDVLTLGLRVAARIAYQREPQSMRHVSLLNELVDLAQARGLPRVKAAALLEKSQLALLDGDVEAAGSYLAQGCHESLWVQTQGLRLFAQEVDDVLIASARLALALGNGALQVAELEAAVRQTHAQGRRWRRLRLQVLLARALAQARRRTQALATLEEALVAGGRAAT